MFETLLLGAGVGLLAVLSPGPVTLALVEIGASRGRKSGVRAGVGVAGADLVMSALALTLVVAGTGLPPSIVGGAQMLSSLFLVTVGIGLVWQPGLGRSVVGRMRHPFRSMFTITALTPSVFGAWVALFMAMPFNDDPAMLGAFGAGGVAVSWVWHVVLGSTAGTFGPALRSEHRSTLSRVGGISMLAFAAWTML